MMLRRLARELCGHFSDRTYFDLYGDKSEAYPSEPVEDQRLLTQPDVLLDEQLQIPLNGKEKSGA